MSWVADLHIHSHFSMATSKECNPVNLHRWAALKGIALVGTGDFTHPGWRAELRERLLPAEPGFYKAKENPAPEIPGQPEVRFVVTGEISTIYKKNDRTRKVHHLVILPSLEAADRIATRLEALGMNIRSDGRPILGLDSYLLFQLILEVAPDVIFIPAHIWTPHFSVFGSNSGFDTIEECYGDLTPHIWALETGLSSDPAMNWRWSALDRFSLVSNSDAHNPRNLAREANLFATEFSYPGLKSALQDKASDRFAGTLEFFPEEGKYHLDGHRNCQVCWEPSVTREHGMICPVCNRKVTVGVLHRVAELADRPAGFRPEHAKPFLSLVPLREVIGAAMNVGAASRKTERIYYDLLHEFGPELDILMKADLERVAARAGTLISTGIQRLRERKVEIRPGYDGEYGVISLFDDLERREIMGQNPLFALTTEQAVKKPAVGKQHPKRESATGAPGVNPESSQSRMEPAIELSPAQQQVVSSGEAVISVIAGPGAGKTRTLVERIVYLIREQRIDPATITAVTFTNKAATEIKARLTKSFTGIALINRLNLGTFHSLAWRLLNMDPAGPEEQLVDSAEVEALVKEVLREANSSMPCREALRLIGLIKNKHLWEDPPGIPAAMEVIFPAFQKKLAAFRRCDFDDILIKTVALWEESPLWLKPFKSRFTYLLVDEFQDINPLQYRLIKLWAGDCRSLMVIGDPNQSIYGFRASSSKFFDEIASDFPNTVKYRLAANYRSPGLLVEAANALIDPELRQHPVNPAALAAGLTWLKSTVERNAAKAITREIVGLLGGSTMLSADDHSRKTPWIDPQAGYSLSDFAVLYRTNRQAAALETALAAEGLPYRVIGPTATFESETVKDFLSFFRYLLQPEDPFLFRAAITQTRWGLDEAECAVVSRWLAEYWHPGNFVLDCVLRLAVGPLADKLRRFETVYGEFHQKSGNKPQSLVADWMSRSGLQDFIELENFSRISEEYRTIGEFFRFLPLATEADLSRCNRKLAGRETISLSTIHAAKGLEYPVVFLAGAEEGLLPYGANPPPDELLEERRLFYVALTRAKERFYIVSSALQFRGGVTLAAEPSRFIRLLPEHLLTTVELKEKPSCRERQLELF
jgi:uncharacterized protein (TIGR00375 family)